MRTVCSTKGCTQLAITRGRCVAHARAADAARGTNGQRGYDMPHRILRARWEPFVQTGLVLCWRCGRAITAPAWDLGHDDEDRNIYRGPEHAACNRAVKSHNGRGGRLVYLQSAVASISQMLLRGDTLPTRWVGAALEAALAYDRGGVLEFGAAISAPPPPN